MPDFREGHFVMQVDASTPGPSLAQMADIGQRMAAEILALPYIATASQQIGRATLGEDTSGPHQSEFHIELKPGRHGRPERGGRRAAPDRQPLSRRADRCPHLPGRPHRRKPDRRDRRHRGENLRRPSSTNFAGWHRPAHCHGALNGTPGIADLQFKPQSGTPTLMLQLQPAALAASGLKAGDVLDAVETDYAGTIVGQTFAGTRSVNVALLLPASARNRPELLSSLMITGPVGAGAAGPDRPHRAGGKPLHGGA